MAAGEVVWVGVEPLGDRDGRIALYLADHVQQLLAPGRPAATLTTAVRDGDTATEPSERERGILEWLRAHGASFFAPLHEAVGNGYPAETVTALWDLVWRGLVTNDTFHAVRAFTRSRATSRRRARRPEPQAFRSRRLVPPSAEGRWSLVQATDPTASADSSREKAASRAADRRAAAARTASTAWAAATAQQLLARHGIVTREAVGSENIAGGFGVVYPVLKALEENGRARRGYFVAGLGATQFALPGALDLLRSMRDTPEEPEVAVMSATDPANPYGATLKWPAFSADAAPARQARAEADAAPARQGHDAAHSPSAGRGPTRTVGAMVILVDGALTAYLARGDRQLLTWLPEAEPQRSRAARAVARVLIDRARSGGDSPRGMLIEEIDGLPPSAHPLAPHLAKAGFQSGALGFSGN